MRILLVEDDERLLRTIGRALRAKGHRVREALGSEEALEILNHEAFDVVVLDHLMPGLHGASLVVQVRVRAPGTPILCLTGTPQEAAPHGYDDWIAKPVTVDELVAKFKTLLNGGYRT